MVMQMESSKFAHRKTQRPEKYIKRRRKGALKSQKSSRATAEARVFEYNTHTLPPLLFSSPHSVSSLRPPKKKKKRKKKFNGSSSSGGSLESGFGVIAGGAEVGGFRFVCVWRTRAAADGWQRGRLRRWWRWGADEAAV